MTPKRLLPISTVSVQLTNSDGCSTVSPARMAAALVASPDPCWSEKVILNSCLRGFCLPNQQLYKMKGTRMVSSTYFISWQFLAIMAVIFNFPRFIKHRVLFYNFYISGSSLLWKKSYILTFGNYLTVHLLSQVISLMALLNQASPVIAFVFRTTSSG